MAIVLRCPQCEATLRLSDSMAGREGACRQCGGAIKVPSRTSDAAKTPVPGRLLSEASPDEMIQELADRGFSGLLTLINEPKLGARGKPQTTLAHLLDRRLRRTLAPRHVATESLDPDQLAGVLAGLASLARTVESPVLADKPAPVVRATPSDRPKGTPPTHDHNGSVRASGEDDQAPQEPDPRPTQMFAFRGDALGMSLADFRMRHERTVEGRRRRLPWCSDETPGIANPELMSESWHTDAGIVHARLELPFENREETIAGVPSERILYQFLDGRLFQVTAFFEPGGFSKLADALLDKYGPAQSESQQPARRHWWSLTSSIELTEGRPRPRQPGVLRYYHDELLAEAAGRTPSASADL